MKVYRDGVLSSPMSKLGSMWGYLEISAKEPPETLVNMKRGTWEVTPGKPPVREIPEASNAQ